MKKLLRKLPVVAPIVLVLGLGTPYVFGFFIKQRFQDFVTSLNEADQLNGHIITYHRGWFSSNAVVEYHIKIPNSNTPSKQLDQPDLHFSVKETISHGPVILRANPDRPGIPFQFALALIDTKIADSDLNFSGKTLLSLTGKSSTTLESDNLTNHADGVFGLSFVAQGLRARFDVTSQQNSSTGKIVLKALDISSGNTRQQVKDFNFQFQLTKDASDLWYGNREVNITNLSFETPSHQAIVANDIQLRLMNDIKNQQMRIGVSANIKSMQIDNVDYGPQTFSYTFSNVDANGLAQLFKQIQQLQSASQYRVFAFGSLYTQTLNLLSKGMNFHLEQLLLNTSWGKVNGQAEITLAPQTTSATTLTELANHMNATASFNFPMVLAEEIMTDQLYDENLIAKDPRAVARSNAKAKLQEWVNAGWLMPDNLEYKVDIVYEQNQLLVNGKPYHQLALKVEPIVEPTIVTTSSKTSSKQPTAKR